MTRLRLPGAALVPLCLVLFTACGRTATAPAAGSPAARTLTVFAASSLTDAFLEIGSAYTTATGRPVEFNFGASNTLGEQLAQGAPAGVFAPADRVEMTRAEQAGRLAGPAETFARNRLVLIVPTTNPAGLAAPLDLARPRYRLILAAPNVPAGRYARDMIDRLAADPAAGPDFAGRVLANVVSEEPNVRQVVAKVQLGEADAGVVYASDVTPRLANALKTIAIPDRANVVADYPIAPVRGDQADRAPDFIRFVRSPAGQTILERWGFQRSGD